MFLNIEVKHFFHLKKKKRSNVADLKMNFKPEVTNWGPLNESAHSHISLVHNVLFFSNFEQVIRTLKNGGISHKYLIVVFS